LRFSSWGDEGLHAGQADAGLLAPGVDELAPLATALLMDELSVWTKLPPIWRKARAKSAPRFGLAGPKWAATSAPWEAKGA